jgi:hypothetical protein
MGGEFILRLSVEYADKISIRVVFFVLYHLSLMFRSMKACGAQLTRNLLIIQIFTMIVLVNNF